MIELSEPLDELGAQVSLPARVISGASLDVSLALESDDDDFFGDDFESDAESVPLSSR